MKALRALVLGCVLLSAARCSSSSAPTRVLKSSCVVNSDCNDPLLCSFGLCHQACKESRDCPTGQHCLNLPDGAVCQLDEDKVDCTYSSECKAPLKCAVDSRCRVPCVGDGDCLASQVCTQFVCADTSELDSKSHALPVTNKTAPWNGPESDGGEPPDAASGGASGKGGATTTMDASSGGGGAGGASGTGGKGGSGSGGKGGFVSTDAGSGPPTCGDAGLAGFHPSNLEAAGAVPDKLIDLTTFSDFFDTGNAAPNPKAPAWDTFNPPPATTQTVVKLADGSEAAVLWVNSVTMPLNARLSIRGTRPLIIASTGPVDINGTIIAEADALRGWFAGGAPTTVTAARTGICPDDTKAGGGKAGLPDASKGIGPGGGGFCGKGGSGSTDLMGFARPEGGVVYGSDALIPLIGGSAGGTAATGSGGHGGGAVQLVSGVGVVIGDSGVINMAGGGGIGNNGAAGSGGAILLEAPSVTVRGILAANGGAGADFNNGDDGQPNDQPAAASKLAGDGGAGDSPDGKPGNAAGTTLEAAGGGGGVGRIRINTGCGGSLVVASNAVISPSTKSGCYKTGSLL